MNENDLEYNIYCNSEQACYQQILRYANDIYCMCYWSCQKVVLMEYFNNGKFYGRGSAEEATIVNVRNSIYCGAVEACLQSIISNVTNSIYGTGFSVLRQSVITNVGNDLIAVGKRALYLTVIDNVTNVCVM